MEGGQASLIRKAVLCALLMPAGKASKQVRELQEIMMSNDAPCPPLTSHGASITSRFDSRNAHLLQLDVLTMDDRVNPEKTPELKEIYPGAARVPRYASCGRGSCCEVNC
jgi:hypothetical protein